MNYEFIYKGEKREVALTDKRFVSFPGSDLKLEVEMASDGRMFIRKGAHLHEVCAAVNGDRTFVDIDGSLFEFTQPSSDLGTGSGEGGAASDPSKVFAPMPGKVVKVMVKEGDSVEPKQQLIIVEAMKMENVVVAAAKGTVKKVNFSAGEQCDTDTPLVVLEITE